MNFADDIVPGSLVELSGSYCILNNEESMMQYVINAITRQCTYINTERRYIAVVIAKGMLPFDNGTEAFKFDCEALLIKVVNGDDVNTMNKSAYVSAFLKQQLLELNELYVVYAHEWFPSVSLVP